MLENIKKGETDEKIKFFLENARFYSYIDSLFNYLRIPNAYHNEKARVIKVYYAALNSIIKCIEMKSEKELSSYICFENKKKNRDNFLRYLEETKKEIFDSEECRENIYGKIKAKIDEDKINISTTNYTGFLDAFFTRVNYLHGNLSLFENVITKEIKRIDDSFLSVCI